MEKHSHEYNIRKVAELIKDVRVTMMTTLDPDGHLHSRPMATQKTDFDGVFWFFTYADAPKVHEIKLEHEVNLSYMDTDKQHYVSISGKARLLRDKEKARELWSPLHLAWFPGGVDDPRLALLRVDAERAEYWDAPSSTMVQLFGFAKAIVTGKAYDSEGVEHDKVQL